MSTISFSTRSLGQHLVTAVAESEYNFKTTSWYVVCGMWCVVCGVMQ